MAAHRNQYICSSVFIAPAILKLGGNAKFFTIYALSVNEVGKTPNRCYRIRLYYMLRGVKVLPCIIELDS